jgi:23S rRNA (guanosine2251-2'-O)-methyltransferase
MSRRRSELILVLHNVRSAHNVGSMFRTADGLGVKRLYLCGYTPYPELPDDLRPPPVRRKTAASIAKTALGAEKKLDWRHCESIDDCIDEIKKLGYKVIALEQTPKSADITGFRADGDITLVVGNEVDGLDQDVLDKIDIHLQIPMLGTKESFNVSVAAAIALYHLRYMDKNTP